MEINLSSPVAILGFGVEGQYALQFLKGQKITDITVIDKKTDISLPQGIKFRLGERAFDDLSGFKTIIRSPGIKYDLPGLVKASLGGAVITSMTKLLMDVAADRTTAITGSNGKTTTTTLVHKILEAHYGPKLIVGGNDRQPILSEAMDRPKDPVLIETSSFQFADIQKSPYMAAILNITPNHLDWHATLDDYIKAKSHLLRYQKEGDWAILNANDENVSKLDRATPAQHFWIGQRRGAHWAVWEKGHLILCYDGNTEIILHQEDLRVKTHPDNILFAAAIGKLHIVPTTTIREQIMLFNGVPQRLEYVRTLRDIHFYNDSSCTTPESAEIVIGQFPNNHLILMLGGSSKKADFSYLAQKIVHHGVRVYLYGQEGERIQQAIIQAGGEDLILNYNTSGNFGQIVEDVYKRAKSEDVIVLSPACASFDMFKNSKERGKLFSEIVKGL